jgi:hypothetical protein
MGVCHQLARESLLIIVLLVARLMTLADGRLMMIIWPLTMIDLYF